VPACVAEIDVLFLADEDHGRTDEDEENEQAWREVCDLGWERGSRGRMLGKMEPLNLANSASTV
jgi:hypothetical protein